jgi:hypothetical protein
LEAFVAHWSRQDKYYLGTYDIRVFPSERSMGFNPEEGHAQKNRGRDFAKLGCM